MIKSIVGKKLGMTQLFTGDGILVPVTVIEAGPCSVVQIKKKDKDGYTALQLGFGDRRESLLNKPERGHFKKAKVSPKRILREVRLDDVTDVKRGDTIMLDFQEGSYVDITGISIGKGFQGGVKRWGWRGGKASHGSMHHRTVGSVSGSSFPSRIFKGHHMPGRMGHDRVTVQNLEVLKVDKEKNLLVVRGSVPGHKNSTLFIREAKKKKTLKQATPSQEAPAPTKESKPKGKKAKK
jgi:large subunit ribosomal protein L3